MDIYIWGNEGTPFLKSKISIHKSEINIPSGLVRKKNSPFLSTLNT